MIARGRLLALSLVVTLVGIAGPTSAADGPTGMDVVELVALSNRADLVSGGNVLVEVRMPDGADASTLTLWLSDRAATTPGSGDRDVTDAFALRPNGLLQGLVKDLPLGESVLTARLGDGRGAWLAITNHPNGGPVFSGPQIQPWVCQETAVDDQCNQPATYELLYRSTDDDAGWQPYDPDNPPDDVAMTTTETGVTMPFVVRVETGYQDRDQYRIATLFQPGEPWEPWAPQEQWNHKVLMTHGGGCGVTYGAGGAPSVLNDDTVPALNAVVDLSAGTVVRTALSRGFAVMSTALNNTGHNCNIVVGAESMMMAKEHFAETYGPIRYTIGVGCSGGSVEAQAVSNAYPGIYQGIIVTCSYPDVFSPGLQFADYHLLRLYFEDIAARLASGIVWSPTQWAAVEGHLTHVNAVLADEGLFKVAVIPTNPCGGVTDEQRYHPESNPGGVRCGVLDYMINQLGPREEEHWSTIEQLVGRGFAGRPFGNAGVQYGLEALREAVITPAQFVDLNAEIGGLDIDIQRVPERQHADAPAQGFLHRTGLVNDARQLDQVAIIDHGGPEPGVAHDASWAWALRERIRQQHERIDNHVIWFGQTPVIGDRDYSRQALLAMDQWLDAVDRDERGLSLPDKIVANRPPDLVDRCTSIEGVSLDVVPGVGALCEFDLFLTRFVRPRTVAGDHFPADTQECVLRPMQRDEYGVVPFTDAEWQRLQEVFPGGVCDYTQPSIGRGPSIAWLSYGDADRAILGGRPLGPAPVSVPFGPASTASPLPTTGGGMAIIALALALTAGLAARPQAVETRP